MEDFNNNIEPTKRQNLEIIKQDYSQQIVQAQQTRVHNSCLKWFSLGTVTITLFINILYLFQEFKNLSDQDIIQNFIKLIVLSFGVYTFNNKKPINGLIFIAVFSIQTIEYFIYQINQLDQKVELSYEETMMQIKKKDENRTIESTYNMSDTDFKNLLKKRKSGIILISLFISILQFILFWYAYRQMKQYHDEAVDIFLEKKLKKLEKNKQKQQESSLKTINSNLSIKYDQTNQFSDSQRPSQDVNNNQDLQTTQIDIIDTVEQSFQNNQQERLKQQP